MTIKLPTMNIPAAIKGHSKTQNGTMDFGSGYEGDGELVIPYVSPYYDEQANDYYDTYYDIYANATYRVYYGNGSDYYYGTPDESVAENPSSPPASVVPGEVMEANILSDMLSFAGRDSAFQVNAAAATNNYIQNGDFFQFAAFELWYSAGTFVGAAAAFTTGVATGPFAVLGFAAGATFNYLYEMNEASVSQSLHPDGYVNGPVNDFEFFH